MRLRRLGLGYKRIARIIEERYGVSLNPGMICNWVRGRYHPLGRCNRIVEGLGWYMLSVGGLVTESLPSTGGTINIMLSWL